MQNEIIEKLTQIQETNNKILEEVEFIKELRKNKSLYALLVEDLKRGMDFLESKIN